MNAPAPSRSLIPALAAAAGVVVAHAVDYIVLFPQRGARDAYLHATGHGYWPLAVAVATGAAALAVLLVAGGAVLGAARGSGAPVRFGALVAWQMVAFVMLEVGERGLAGVPASAVVQGHELWLGLLLQLPVAWLVHRVLRGVDRTSAALGARWRRPPLRSGRPVLVGRPVAAPPRLLFASAARPRGPPG